MGTSSKWAHVDDTTEYCSIRVYETVDIDCLNGEDLVGANYYKEADFDGGTKGTCQPATHASATKWYASGTGQSAVTATLIDKDDPHEDADDKNVTITLGQHPSNGHFVAGFTVLIEGNISGEFAETNWTVSEGETDSKTKQAGNWSAWKIVTGNGNNANVVKASAEKSVSVSWTFKTVPSDAHPRKNIKAKLRYVPTAYWEYNFEDDDTNDGNGGFSVSVGYVGGIGYSWGMPDTHEGSFAGVWAYSTDASGVGSSRQPQSPDFSDSSSVHAERTIPWNISPQKSKIGNAMQIDCGDGYVSRPRGESVGSTYTISGNAAAVDNWDTDSWSKTRVKFGQSVFYVDEVTY